MVTLCLMEAKGVNGQLVFDGVRVTIVRVGRGARLGHAEGPVSFDVADVESVSVRPAGFATNGLVLFKLRGAVRFVGPDFAHPNSVIFKKAQWVDFEPIVAAVRDRKAITA